jgi:heptaprenyl diphosphate synthase
MKETNETANVYKIAFLVSISCVLQISESLIPHPIPGLKLGLANVITLITLVTMGWRCAIEVTILRTLLSSFIMGTFMSPTFILSFSGGIISTLIMALLYRWSYSHRRYRLSIVGISVVGALFHNITQIYLAYFMLVRHPGIFVLFPWLSIGAVFMGWVTGLAAGGVCRKLKEAQENEVIIDKTQTDYSSLVLKNYVVGNSLIHKLSAGIKIVVIFILSLAVLIFSNIWFYVGLFVFLFITIAISKTSFTFLFSRVRRYTSLVLISFLFPIFLNHGNNVLLHIAYFNITVEGINTGVVFVMRIIFLILASSLLVRTTSPEDLTNGLTKILSPLTSFGISSKRIASILSLSWMAVPIFWEMARNTIRKIDLKKVRNIRNLIPLLSDFIVTLYLETEQVAKSWEDDYIKSVNINGDFI